MIQRNPNGPSFRTASSRPYVSPSFRPSVFLSSRPSVLPTLRPSVFLSLLPLLLFLTGCRSHRSAQLPPVQLRDSLRIEIRERLVTVHDTAYIEVPAQSQSQQVKDSTSHLETDFAESDARINADGTLSHSLRNKPQQLAAPTETKVSVRDSVVYRDREVPVPQPYPVEKPFTLWQKFLMGTGSLALGFLTAVLTAMAIRWRKRRKG